jgi:hypothetical protein
MKLTDTAIRNAKAGGDLGDLYLRGSTIWR